MIHVIGATILYFMIGGYTVACLRHSGYEPRLVIIAVILWPVFLLNVAYCATVEAALKIYNAQAITYDYYLTIVERDKQ